MTSLQLSQAAAALRAELAQRRLDPDRLSLYEGWKAFKAFGRMPISVADEECSVEFRALAEEDSLTHVILSRHLATLDSEDEDDPTPQHVRTIVIDIGYEVLIPSFKDDPVFRDVDYVDFEAFVTAVESSTAFQDAVAREAVGSSVFENEE